MSKSDMLEIRQRWQEQGLGPAMEADLETVSMEELEAAAAKLDENHKP